LPAQHPVAQEVAVHWQVADAPEPTHCWPAPHGAPVEPHAHPPVEGSQRFESIGLHDEQALPVARQVGHAMAGVHDVPLAQHPAAQLVASHTHPPPLQWSPALHAAPEAPQEQAPLRH
jgi:hypothetical protein